jgi:hypothetical protein
MAKATNPRKPARDTRKGGAAAKRTASKRPTQARKFSAGTSSRRGRTRVMGRPSGGRAPAGARRAQGAEVRAEVLAPPAPEPPRTPPPLPVPIASFTF